MHSAVSYVAGGLTAALVMGVLPVPVPVPDYGTVPRISAPVIPLVTVDRARKGDREPQPAITRRVRTIAVVEVVGLPNPSIVYRDSDGQVLFHADPANRTTVIAKETLVPEITIRGTAGTAVVPAGTAVVPARQAPQAPPRPRGLKFGCDPAFSPLTVPAEANMTSRCLAGAAKNWHMAAATD
jgi:hypothetical protein